MFSQKAKMSRFSAPFCYLLYLSTTLCTAQKILSIGVNELSSGVRVSGGHLLTKAPLPKGGWRREATGGYNIPPPQAVPLPLGEGGFISQIFSNRDTIICNSWEFILQEFTFEMENVIIFAKSAL